MFVSGWVFIYLWFFLFPFSFFFLPLFFFWCATNVNFHVYYICIASMDNYGCTCTAVHTKCLNDHMYRYACTCTVHIPSKKVFFCPWLVGSQYTSLDHPVCMHIHMHMYMYNVQHVQCTTCTMYNMYNVQHVQCTTCTCTCI